MKFRDIEQFTRDANYQVSIPLIYLQKTIDDYILRHELNLNPDFQRHHVWDTGRREAFVEYILRGGTSAKRLYFNHPGWMHSFEGEFVLVDGKQRLTSLLMFLNNEIQVRETFYKDFEDKLSPLTDIIFCVNDLKTRAEVLQWYIDINAGGIVHTDEEIEKVRALLQKESR